MRTRSFAAALILVGTGCVDSREAIDWEYQMAYQRGIEAVTWAIPAVSMLNMREATFSLGGGFNTVYWMSRPPTALQEALTANNQTPYANVTLNTSDGPMVLDIPPSSDRTAIFGSAVDVWQVPVADMGPAGMDQGRGGKYLFLPPGFEGQVPSAYFAVQMQTYNVFVALRLIPLGDASFSEAAEYSKSINAYPLAQAANPPSGEYIDMGAKHLPTLPVFDLSYYGDIVTLLDEEPLLERDMVMGGMLAAIGIEKGKPFTPEGTVKEALERAVVDGKAHLDHLFETPGNAIEVYWPDRQWTGLRQPSSEGFVFDKGDYLLLDARGAMFNAFTFIPQQLGRASAYLMALKDADGAPLSGGGTYRLTVPSDVPARNFWSVIAYSMDTKAFIYNEADKVGLSSYDDEILQFNDDGTVDVFFSETAPDGLESNWIPTAGEDFFLIFRFYGPEEPFFDKSFKLPDLERIK